MKTLRYPAEDNAVPTRSIQLCHLSTYYQICHTQYFAQYWSRRVPASADSRVSIYFVAPLNLHLICPRVSKRKLFWTELAVSSACNAQAQDYFFAALDLLWLSLSYVNVGNAWNKRTCQADSFRVPLWARLPTFNIPCLGRPVLPTASLTFCSLSAGKLARS